MTKAVGQMARKSRNAVALPSKKAMYSEVNTEALKPAIIITIPWSLPTRLEANNTVLYKLNCTMVACRPPEVYMARQLMAVKHLCVYLSRRVGVQNLIHPGKRARIGGLGSHQCMPSLCL